MEKTFSKNQKREKESVEMDITSLLDILVILLFFLLQSYNASELSVDVVKNLEVADSESKILGEMALIVQVDKDKNIYIKNRKLSSFNDLNSMSEFKSALEDEKKEYKNEMKDGYPLNLVFDKELEYDSIKTLMNAAAEEGFTKFKLIVQGD